MLPNFIIIGTQKGGTSSLYKYIGSHPDISPSSIKETNFFKTGDDFNKGLNWYKSLFNKNGKYAFEASPNYTMRSLFAGVPARMHSVLPKIKLIYLVRDPIERTVSGYLHSYAGRRESRSFSEAIKNPNIHYIQTSKYYFQIQAFLEYYSDKQLLIVESEQLRKDPVTVVSDIFNFLGISVKYDPALLEKRFHVSSSKRGPSSVEQKFTRKTNNPYLKTVIRGLTLPLRKKIDRPAVSPVEREMLAEAIAPDIEKLRQFSGLKFPDWSL